MPKGYRLCKCVCVNNVSQANEKNVIAEGIDRSHKIKRYFGT